MSPVCVNSFRVAPPIASDKILIGYLGNMNNNIGDRSDVAEAFDGDTVETNVEGALTVTSDASDGIIGYDYIFDSSAGRKVEKVVMYSTSGDGGFINGAEPTDVLISIEGWDGVWNAIGNSGTFTDAGLLVKTITSTDQVTLFTRVRAIISSATAGFRLCAEMEIHELTVGQMIFNLVESNMTQASPGGDILSAFNGVTNDIAANSNITAVSSTADATHAVNFSVNHKIQKGIFYASNNGGFIESVDPTDVQLDLEGFNGTVWVALGNTGTFTDAPSLVKTIISSDQTTLFEKVRVVISTATSAKKILTEAEFFILP